MSDTPLLSVRGVHAYYGLSHVLHGVDLDVHTGQIVALLGRNGVGRSTLCKAIMAIVERQGSIRVKGRETIALAPHQMARLGLGYVPEDRAIFPGLTVEQNLILGQHSDAGPKSWTIDQVYSHFPSLERRRATDADVLSGGEKQMLAMCRALMSGPDLILVDEPTEGLAPLIVEQVGELMAEIARTGVSILLIEQKLTMAMRIADHVYVMGHGQTVFSGSPEQLRADQDTCKAWLEV
ncbi:ABC transporter ATP-binding protein [Roseovarius aestuarii]|nr:ABC transporter ATP-binding protein [Roseovarius aestuarii]